MQGIQIRNPGNFCFAYGIWNPGNYLGSWPGFWNPEYSARNPAIHAVESKIQECLDLYFLTWGDKTMLSPQMPDRWNWNSLMTLFILGSVISNEEAFGEMLIRYRWERPDGYLVYPSESTKIQLYISCVNKLGVFKWQEYCKVAKKDVS